MAYQTDEDRGKVIREMFGLHKIKIQEPVSGITHLMWTKPESWIDSLFYLIHKNYLLVYGDLGDAIYMWGQDINLEFLAGLNLDYFASKCQASETGRGGREWDKSTAVRNLTDHLKSSEWSEESISELLAGSEEVLNNAETWANFICDREVGPEEEILEGVYDIGYRPSFRTHCHLIGLKMINEWVQKTDVRDSEI